MPNALAAALRFAYENPRLTQVERELVLIAMAENLNGAEAETAARILHHRREADELQLKLSLLLKHEPNV